MAQLVGSARVMDGTVSVALGTPQTSQSVNIQGRDKQTVRVSVDKQIKVDIQVSFGSDKDADFVTTSDNGVNIPDGSDLVLNLNYSANFMRLNFHDNASASLLTADIHAQQNAT